MDKIKINIVQIIIAIGINVIIGFAFYNYAHTEYRLIFGITSGTLLAIISFFMAGISHPNNKKNLNIKTLSGIFYIIMLIMNLIFMFINFKLPIFIIVNGIIFLIYLSIYSAIQKSRQ
ncbi:hypothetical protein E4O05_06120 [Treponema sp. OMZ 787]|uniref:hypothetical protein n=1 Tax=Treponema sp. OMZ 787 TaxID=2563669 RepID=UPI0020A579AB|nr:hypothetical protein [Treponema sp. OMZ 787]UTC63456.1 hypothetical protein E4O05_06120 [Treponema sp. OMZ 787]